MPLRASGNATSTVLGRVLFRGKTSSRQIAKKISSVQGTKLQDAMEKRGMKGTSVKSMADMLAGKDRGVSQQELRKTVQVLQDVGLAKNDESASKMVLTASRAASGEGTISLKAVLTPEQYKKHMQKLARERRDEERTASAPKTGEEEPLSARDRMRGAQGRANAVGAKGAAAGSGARNAEHGASEEEGVRELRDSMRKQLDLQPKLVIPPPVKTKKDEDTNVPPSAMFQP